MRTFISYALAAIFGVFLSFLVFAAIFSDGPALERFWTIVVILLGYMVLSLVLGWLSPSTWWWVIGIDFPAVLILTWYAKNEAGSAMICAITGLMIILVSLGGSWLGSHGNKNQDVL